MPNVIEFENIEAMRLQEGIDDVDLRAQIRALRAGDHVNLTVLTGAAKLETLLVRITSIRGLAFRGKLARKPKSITLLELEIGVAVQFSAAHIHSIARCLPVQSKPLLRLAEH